MRLAVRHPQRSRRVSRTPLSWPVRRWRPYVLPLPRGTDRLRRSPDLPPCGRLEQRVSECPLTLHRAPFGRHPPAFFGPLRSTRSPSLPSHYRRSHRYYGSICHPGPLGSPLSVRLPPPSLRISHVPLHGRLPRFVTDGPRVSRGHHESPMPPYPHHSRRHRSPRTASPKWERVALP